MTHSLHDLITLNDLSKITNEDRQQLICRIIQNEIKPTEKDNDQYWFKLSYALQIKHMLVGNYPLTMSDIVFLSSSLNEDISIYKKIEFLTQKLIQPHVYAAVGSDYQLGLFLDEYLIKEWLLILKKQVSYIQNTEYFIEHACYILQSEAGVIYQNYSDVDIKKYDDLLLKFRSIEFSNQSFEKMVDLINICLFEIPKYAIYQTLKYAITNIVSLFNQQLCDDLKIKNIKSFNNDIHQLCLDILMIHLPIQSHIKVSNQKNNSYQYNIISSSWLNTHLKHYVQLLFDYIHIQRVEINQLGYIDNHTGSILNDVCYKLVIYLKINNGCISRAEAVNIDIPFSIIEQMNIVKSDDDIELFFEILAPYINIDEYDYI